MRPPAIKNYSVAKPYIFVALHICIFFLNVSGNIKLPLPFRQLKKWVKCSQGNHMVVEAGGCEHDELLMKDRLEKERKGEEGK